MLSYKLSNPNCITLLTTFRCNAACVDCCFGCRPTRGRTMSLEEMKHYVDVCTEAYPDSITRLALSGGECFLLGDNLDEIVKYGVDKGLSVDFISNGYWGKTIKEATKRLIQLKNNGLKEVGFTVGADHDHIIPLRNCRNAAIAAAQLGYRVEFRIESARWGQPQVFEEFLKNDATFMRLVNDNKIRLKFWRWQEYNNEVSYRRLAPWKHRPYEKSKPCDLLFNTIVITPYGDVLACCGIGNSRNPHMRLGNIWNEPIQTIYERTGQDLLKVWIGVEGAQAILQYVYDNSDIRFHKTGNNCESCMEIFENPRILPFLRDHYDDWYEKLCYRRMI